MYVSLCTKTKRSPKYMKWTKQGADQCVWYAIVCININKKGYGGSMCVCVKDISRRLYSVLIMPVTLEEKGDD